MGGRSEAHPLLIRAESLRLSRAAIEAFAEEIPSDTGRLDALLEASIDRCFARAFTVLVLSAIHREIPVDARHLVRGARLLPNPGFIGKLSANMTGDVVGALVGAVEDGRLSRHKEAVALYLAASFRRERGLDAHGKQIVRRTRMLARVAYGLEVQAFIAAASEILADEELSGLIARFPAGRLLPTVGLWTEPFLELVHAPILEGLDEEDEPAPSGTRRRAVDRVGRNDPCPCGSGKKYKRCCSTKDQGRLRDSSDIAGVTRAELRLHLEEYLTLDRVHTLRAHELARLDPRRIDPELHPIILNRLIQFEEFDAVRDFFEALGVDDVEGHFLDAIDAAVRAGKTDDVKAFLELASLPDEDWLGFPLRLLKEGIETSPALDLLEAEAEHLVDSAAVDVACDLMRGRWPHVGILIARGVAPLAHPLDRDTLLEEIGLARDRLDLPALEPTEGMQDLWGWGEESELFEDLPLHVEPAQRAPESPPRDEVARGCSRKKRRRSRAFVKSSLICAASSTST